MQLSRAKLVEILLEAGLAGGRFLCPPALIPAPGQYLLAHIPGSDSPLPVPVFNVGPAPGGFIAAAPLPGDSDDVMLDLFLPRPPAGPAASFQAANILRTCAAVKGLV